MKKLAYILLCCALLAVIWIVFFKPERPLPGKDRFEYMPVTVNDQSVDCKYIAFDHDLTVNRVTAFDIKENLSAYPQWIRYIQYHALINDANSQGFDPEMYHANYPERAAYFHKNWDHIRKSKAKYAEKKMTHSQDPNVAMKGTISGLLFIRIKEVEYVVIRINYKAGDTKDYSGKYAVWDNNNLIQMDEEIFHPNIDFLTSCFGQFDKIVSELQKSDHGVYVVKSNPMRWSLSAITE